MKIDRFVKSMLVLIALFLALSCVNGFNLSSNARGTSVEAAAPPSLLLVGKSYEFSPQVASGPAEVLEIQNTGWVRVRDPRGGSGSSRSSSLSFWVNTNACVAIYPR
jgi:hypothetical protein